MAIGSSNSRLLGDIDMNYRFDRIKSHLEGCLQQAEVFERAVDGSQLFDLAMMEKPGATWLVLAAGVSDAESSAYFRDEHTRERATVPMQVTPSGRASMLLILRPQDEKESLVRGKYVAYFSRDVGWVEIRQGCYVRVDDLGAATVRQIRWELDPVEGHKPPQEAWLRSWADLVGCNPAHAPSHWHINSPPIEIFGRRRERRVIIPPELRLATGLPNPLLLILSIVNWLRRAT